MWSYLINSNSNSNSNILTFECVNSKDYMDLGKGYCELILDNYFSSFSSDYDTIFISEYGPESDPQNKKQLFQMKFDDVVKAKEYILQKTK